MFAIALSVYITLLIINIFTGAIPWSWFVLGPLWVALYHVVAFVVTYVIAPIAGMAFLWTLLCVCLWIFSGEWSWYLG